MVVVGGTTPIRVSALMSIRVKERHKEAGIKHRAQNFLWLPNSFYLNYSHTQNLEMLSHLKNNKWKIAFSVFI